MKYLKYIAIGFKKKFIHEKILKINTKVKSNFFIMKMKITLMQEYINYQNYKK